MKNTSLPSSEVVAVNNFCRLSAFRAVEQTWCVLAQWTESASAAPAMYYESHRRLIDQSWRLQLSDSGLHAFLVIKALSFIQVTFHPAWIPIIVTFSRVRTISISRCLHILAHKKEQVVTYLNIAGVIPIPLLWVWQTLGPDRLVQQHSACLLALLLPICLVAPWWPTNSPAWITELSEKLKKDFIIVSYGKYLYSCQGRPFCALCSQSSNLAFIHSPVGWCARLSIFQHSLVVTR